MELGSLVLLTNFPRHWRHLLCLEHIIQIPFVFRRHQVSLEHFNIINLNIRFCKQFAFPALRVRLHYAKRGQRRLSECAFGLHKSCSRLRESILSALHRDCKSRECIGRFALSLYLYCIYVWRVQSGETWIQHTMHSVPARGQRGILSRKIAEMHTSCQPRGASWSEKKGWGGRKERETSALAKRVKCNNLCQHHKDEFKRGKEKAARPGPGEQKQKNRRAPRAWWPRARE